MGFLDDIKKGLGDAADGINKAVQGATTSTNPPPPGAAPTVAPAGWITPEQLGGLAAQTGMGAITFGPPSGFERADASVARFASTDGATTVDVGAVNEATLGALVGVPAVLAHYAQVWTAPVEVADLGDGARSGSTGPGQRGLICCRADSAVAVDVYAPAALPEATLQAFLEAVMRALQP